MAFLTAIGNLEVINDEPIWHEKENPDEVTIEDKILACNPILESYGNAKTERNDNSSRFGKYVQLLINKETRKTVGARIDNYLLEKSRVCLAPVEERNYHIFYSMCRGMTDD